MQCGVPAMWKIRASAEGGEIRLGTAATLAALDGPGGDVDGKLSEPNDTCSKFALAVHVKFMDPELPGK